ELTGLQVSSADPTTSDDNDTYNVSLGVANGTLNVGGAHTGLIGTFTGATISFVGSLSDVNAALVNNNVSYTPNSEFEGQDTLTLTSSTTEDASVGGNTSAPVSTTANIDVAPVADPPVLTVDLQPQPATDEFIAANPLTSTKG